ncbi:GntR family transcriptional regulator [Enteractinococcus helveticum]|uniref:HTH gntR-type domain-containing protein n=1 Tax=Enteractinococcus helveticum TaxID=1837282 RepID=A0A1B7M0C8_9MICC|nr:GntR family transcriptional regulator [Enteractinococcus helveticum]OAV61519.1 hypothetical protein A6F49_08750 [Enteractinococcus helveticum]
MEHQLRTGIGIGVLEAGTRLPNEQIMARHMGVSALTFRQALDRLREARLVSTRPGRGGGTFISASLSALEQLSQQALSDISLAKIADLGHSVSELHASAARLAAQRRDDIDINELRLSADRLLEPMTAIERRRASTLYVITIARIARSETLLAALVPLIGEFQLLAWTDEANGLIAELNHAAQQTVDAILRAAHDEAAEAARKHLQLIARQIVRERSLLFATRVTQDDLSPQAAFHELLGHIQQIRASLQNGCQRLIELEAPRYARAEPSDEIDAILKNIASQNNTLLRGAGIAYAPGMLEDSRLWMDWWDSDYGLDLTFKSHDFNARSLQYYDYEHMRWFTEPLRTGKFSVIGPYLDRGGIETSTITVSLPITEGAYAGCVLGADLHIPGIEEILLSKSKATAHDHILVTDAKRVLVSTSPVAMHGALLEPSCTGQLTVVAQENGHPLTHWQLLTAAGNDNQTPRQ